MHALVKRDYKIEEDLLVGKVLVYGVQKGIIEENRARDIRDYNFPELAYEVMREKNYQQSRRDVWEQVAREVAHLCNLGLDLKVDDNLERGAKLLIHPQGGLRWCFKHGYSILSQYKQEAFDLLSKLYIKIPSKSPAALNDYRKRKGSNSFFLLSSSDTLPVGDFIPFGKKPIDLSARYAEDLLVFPTHRRIKTKNELDFLVAELETTKTKLQFIETLDISSLKNCSGLWSADAGGVVKSSDISEKMFAGLVVNLAISDFKKEIYEVNIDKLQRFREMFWKDDSFDISFLDKLDEFISVKTNKLSENTKEYVYNLMRRVGTDVATILASPTISIESIEPTFIIPNSLITEMMEKADVPTEEDNIVDEFLGRTPKEIADEFYLLTPEHKQLLFEKLPLDLGSEVLHLVVRDVTDQDALMGKVLKNMNPYTGGHLIYNAEELSRQQDIEEMRKDDFPESQKVEIVPWEEVFFDSQGNLRDVPVMTLMSITWQFMKSRDNQDFMYKVMQHILTLANLGQKT